MGGTCRFAVYSYNTMEYTCFDLSVLVLQTIRYIVEDSDTWTILNGGRLHPVSGFSTAATNLL